MSNEMGSLRIRILRIN